MNTSEFFTDEILQKWNNLMPSTMFPAMCLFFGKNMLLIHYLSWHGLPMGQRHPQVP